MLKTCRFFLLLTAFMAAGSTSALARIKLAALPERTDIIIRLDNPTAALIEEERRLTLQQGVNRVDFSWAGVRIEEDSIRLGIISHPEKVTLLNVSYPPSESALVWEIASSEPLEVLVRISYLLYQIDSLIQYKAVANRDEDKINLKSLLVIRNFSGENFHKAAVIVDPKHSMRLDLDHEETKQLLFWERQGLPIAKVWTFDAGKLPWDPDKESGNVGIPVTYRIHNSQKSGLGRFKLPAGKIRVFQESGSKSTVFLGEDRVSLVPVNEKMKVYIGDSRDIVVKQFKMKDKRVNIRRNKTGRVVLYDTDEIIKASIENFKDKEVVLTLIEHIPGQWEMKKSNLKYKRKSADAIEFEIKLPAHGKVELIMNYSRKNVR